MKRSKPPFRADHVGSILRTVPIKAARTKREKGEIGADALREIEDREIEKIIKKQEEIGLELATDGEFRRSWWHFDFLGLLDGAEVYESGQGIQFQGVTTKGQSIRVNGKIDFPADHPMLDHFKFLKAHTRVTPKMTIPSPSVLHYRGGREAIDKQAYPSMDGFFDDLGKTYRKAVRAFYDAGCRYLQFDDTVWAYLCSEDQRQKARARGEDVDKLPSIYAKVINEAISDRPADMTITTHVCRGNFRSTFISEGGYEPVAETLFGKVNYDGYFLEYDTERAGGFEPLRFVPKGKKTVVLGLVTSKSGTLEKKGDIKRRIDEATKYVAQDQLCLSPQCGFASTEEGNILAADEQWAKLSMIVELADEVWG
jgi:5-methyltetrahydropteroyltriglutamate--homocysteine methyltransferase